MPRVRPVAAVVLALGLLGALLLSGCGSHHQATGFCAGIRRGHSVYDTSDPVHDRAALAAFGRVAASAPAPVAADLQTLERVLTAIGHDQNVFTKQPKLVSTYLGALNRVDTYLRTTCGVSIPKGIKF